MVAPRAGPHRPLRVVLDGRTISDHFPGIGRYTYQLAHALAAELAGRGSLMLIHQPGLAAGRFDLAALAGLPGLTLVPARARPFSPAEQLSLPARLMIDQVVSAGSKRREASILAAVDRPSSLARRNYPEISQGVKLTQASL